MSESETVPNHHADYPGFSGVRGVVGALRMLVGRTGDARWAALLAHLGPDDLVVDVGCGPGVAARFAVRQGASVIGVDPASMMLRVARATTFRARGARFVEGVAEDLPVEQGAASIVWSLATVHHWRDLDRALREVRRVLGPGGRFVAIERHTEPGATGLASHGWTTAQADAFVELLGDHDFEQAHAAHHDTGRRQLVGVIASVRSGVADAVDGGAAGA